MPQIIEVPGMGQVSFPDGMTDADITSAIQRNIPSTAPDFSPAARQARMDERNAASKAEQAAPSMLGSFGREAARSVGPGLAGMATGAASGAALGAAGINPITVGIGGVVGGLAGFMGARAGQDKLADTLAPDSFAGTKAAEQDFATNKWSSMLGGAVGGGGMPGPFRAMGAVGKMLTADGRQVLVHGLRPGADKLAATASRDIMEPLVAGGVGGGLGILTGTGPQDVAEQAGLGMLFNRGWHPKSWQPQFGRPQISTESQNGAQGDPATGATPGGEVMPVETNAAVVTPMKGDGLVPSGPTRLAADLARQLGIDPNAITPSGAGGKVTPNDVRRAGANLPAQTLDSGGTVDLTPARKAAPTLSDLIGRDTEWQGYKGKLIDDQGRPALELPGGEVVELPFNFHTERSIADLGIVPTGDRAADRHAATRLFGDTEGDAMTQVFSHIDTQTDNVIDIAELGASLKRQGTGHVPVRDTPEFAQHARGVTDESILAAHDQIAAALAAAESHPNLSNDTRTAITDKLRGDIDNLTALSAARDAWQRERIPLPVGSPEIPSQRATLAATAAGDNRSAAVRELNRQSPVPIPVTPEPITNPKPVNATPPLIPTAEKAAEPVTPVAEVVPKPLSAPEPAAPVTPEPVTPATPINERVFSDEYTGERWTYGLRNRPMGLGAQPKGFIIGSDGPPGGRARHGTIQYPRELTANEIYDFELEVIPDKPVPVIPVADAPVAQVVVPSVEPAPLVPLKGAPHLAQWRVDNLTKQLAKLEAAGNGDSPQAAKLRANIEKVTAQIEAAGGVKPGAAKQLKSRVDAVHDSGEFDIITKIRQNGGFQPPAKGADHIDRLQRKGAKLGEKSRKIADGFGETRDDASRPGSHGTDDGGKLADATLKSLHNRSPKAMSVDKMAGALGMTVKDFHAKLNDELAQIARQNGPRGDEQQAHWNKAEKQHADFTAALETNKATGTGDKVTAGVLAVGDTFRLGGEKFKVTHSDVVEGFDGPEGTMVVQDHDKFGTQPIDPQQEIAIAGKGREPVSDAERARAADLIPQTEHPVIDEYGNPPPADDDTPSWMRDPDPVDPPPEKPVIEENPAKPADPTPEKPAADELVLKAHADDAEIKAEAAAAKQKGELDKRLHAPLKGSAGDLTPDIFGEGDTPLFNERRDQPAAKGLIAGIKAHQEDVRGWINGEKRSGRLNSMPVDILGAQAWDAALSVAIHTLEAGKSIGAAVKDAIAHIRQSRSAANQLALTRSEEASIKSHIIAKAQDQRRYQGERDAKFMREMPKVAEELAANGQTPTVTDLIDMLAKRFPDNAAYIRRNGDQIFQDMLFARDTRMSRTTESARQWGEWADKALEGASHLIDSMRKGAPMTNVKQFATAFHATYMTGIGNKMRHLAQGGLTGTESKAFGKFTEKLVGLAKGADGVHTIATDLQMHADLKRFANQVDSIKTALAPMLNAMPRRERDAFMERVGDHITDASRDGELASQPELKRAVESYVKLREDLLKHMKISGVQVGDAGPRTMRRVLDRPTILSNDQEFLKQAANAYKAKWRVEVAKLNAESATLDPVKDKSRLSAIQSEITEIGKRDAADSALKYFHNIQAEEVGISSDGNDLFTSGRGNPSMLKSREFGPEADQLLGKFYLRNPDAILRTEIGDAVRAAGVAKTFSGPAIDGNGKPMQNGEIDPMAKWKALRGEMIAEGNHDMIPAAATLMKEYFGLGGQDNPTMRKALEIAHTHAQLAYLARSAFSSMTEPALAGIRTGKLSDVARGYVGTVKGMYRELRHMAPEESRILSNAIGFSADGFNSVLAANRFLDSYGGHGKGGELVAMFHEKTWLTALTNATHASAMDIGHSFIRTQLELRGAGGKYKTLAGKHLNEVGITSKDIPAMLKFTDDFAKSQDKLGLLTADTPEAKLYRDALHMFKTSGGSLEVTRGVRPQHANSPAGGMFYALQSFLFAFQDQILSRHARLLRTAYRGQSTVDGVAEKLSGAERSKIVGNTLMGVATIAATQYAVQRVRETLYSDPARVANNKTLSPGELAKARAYQVLSRSSVMGGYDILFNMATGARYGSDPATRILGPSLGAASSIVGQAIGVAAGNKNSPNTNTAERKLARTVWGFSAQPAMNVAAATMPGGGLASALVQAQNHPAIRELAVRSVAGPPMIQGKPKGPMRIAQ